MKLGIVISLAVIALSCGGVSPTLTDDLARNKICLMVGWSDRVPGELRDALAAARRHDGTAMAESAGRARDLGQVSIAALNSFGAGSVPTDLPQDEIRKVAIFAEQGAFFFGDEPPDDVALHSFEAALPTLDDLVRAINAASGDCL